MAAFTHLGPWNDDSRQYPVLRFLEQYQTTVDSLDFNSVPSSTFYAPEAVYYDTRGDVYNTGPHIWDCMRRNLNAFEYVHHEAVEIRVLPESNFRSVVYAEFMTHFRLRGDIEEVIAPRLFVFTIEEEEHRSGGGGGMYGLQLHAVSLYWDTSILARHVTRNRRELQS